MTRNLNYQAGQAVHFKIGQIEITRIGEVLELGYEPEQLFKNFNRQLYEDFPILRSENFFNAESGRLMSSVHSWLLRIDGITILVDTCSGNGRRRELPLFQRFHMLDYPWLDHLRAAGVEPEHVDIVINSHLHLDHVGWNTHEKNGKWIPTFPNARYLINRAEFKHWEKDGLGRKLFPANIAVIEDSIEPIVDAGLVELIEPGYEVIPGLTIEEAPGHTAHMVIVKYDSPEGKFIISADAMHQPIQVFAPHLSSRFCGDRSCRAI
ncbi:MBL fold metallo-hydrolase [Acinetobacter baumannii]